MRLRPLKAFTTAYLIFSLSQVSMCADAGVPSDDSSNGSKKPNDWLQDLIDKGRLKMDEVKESDFYVKFKPFLSSEGLQEASKIAHDAFESGTPGEIGYGFLMGYTSGFCVKRVSKFIAFGVGGVFLIIQALSYNGYLAVNYDKLQKDVETMLDLNNDGKFDSEDIQYAFTKLQDVSSYNMPAGGGFVAGLIMGLRG